MEYDARLAELRTAAAGKPESEVGGQIIPAEEPNWNKVLELGEELMGRSKNMEVALILCLAAMVKEGLPGLRSGFELLSGLVTNFWDDCWPKLDPDEPESDRFIERTNLLENLSREVGSYGDPIRFIARLRKVPLARSRSLGVVTSGAIHGLRSGGSAPADDSDEESAKPAGLDEAQVRAIFSDTEPEELAANRESAAAVLTLATDLEARLGEACGESNAPNFGPLLAELKFIHRCFADFAGGDAEAAPGETDAGEESAAAAGAAPRSAPPGEIRSREDVLRALDKIVAYYEKNEPSSPLPFFLKRCRKLVSSDFLSIIRNLSPDYESEFSKILDAPRDEE